MAEIKIEKKKPVWPWIILILIIVAGILFYVFVYEDSTTDDLDDFNNTNDIEELNETSSSIQLEKPIRFQIKNTALIS